MTGISPYSFIIPGDSNSQPSNIKTGTAEFLGDGFTDTFVIPHNLGITPKYANAVSQNFASIGSISVVWNSTNITVMYSTAPDAEQLKFTWIAIL